MPGVAVEHESEVERLRARVTELEAELADRAERANAAVAAAEDRVYWLERWKIDLDAVMQQRRGRWALQLLEHARRARRVAGRVRRRLRR